MGSVATKVVVLLDHRAMVPDGWKGLLVRGSNLGRVQSGDVCERGVLAQRERETREGGSPWGTLHEVLILIRVPVPKLFLDYILMAHVCFIFLSKHQLRSQLLPLFHNIIDSIASASLRCLRDSLLVHLSFPPAPPPAPLSPLLSHSVPVSLSKRLVLHGPVEDSFL